MRNSLRLPVHRHRRVVHTSERRLLYRIVEAVWHFVFGVLICAGVYALAVLHAQAIGDHASLYALQGWLIAMIVAGLIRLTHKLLRKELPRVQRLYDNTPRVMRGLQYKLAWALACAFIIIIAASHFPRLFLWEMWPLFMPGMIIMVHRFSLDEQPGAFPRPVTQRAMVYAGTAAVSVAVAAQWMPGGIAGGPFGRAVVPTAMLPPLLDEGVLPALFTAGALMGIYALMRQSDLARLQGEIVTRQFEKLVRQNNLGKFWQSVAESIQVYFRLKRVVVIVPDDHYHDALCAVTDAQRVQCLRSVRFTVTGIAGEGAEKLEARKYHARGIALSVLTSGRPKRVPNVNKEKDYYPNGLTDTQAELHVPVLDHEHENEVLAIIVSQETRRFWAFTPDDQENLQRVADYLASYSRQLNQNANYRRLHFTSAKLDTLKQDVRVRDLLNAARTVFRTNCVAYIPLAFATYRPLLSGAEFLPEGFPDGLNPDTNWLDVSSGIPELIRKWKPLMITDFNHGPVTDFWRSWATARQLKALALVPVGALSGSGALFIIGFRQPVMSSKRHLRVLLGAFANNLSPLIDRYWRQWWTYEKTFVAPTVEMHQLLNRYSLSHDSVDNTVNTAMNGDARVLQTLCQNIKLLVKELYDVQGVSSPINNEGRLLERAVTQFATSLEGRYGVKGIWWVDPRIESESIELKSMLYRVICEAMMNSVGHGHASQVNVIAARRRDCIEILVQDDGIGFDPATLAVLDEHRHGIIALCQRLAELTGSTPADWVWTMPGCGACLKISVPCLPFSGTYTAEYEDFTQKMSRLEALYERPAKRE